MSFLDLKEKEVINVFNGKKLGRIIDLIFDTSNGEMLGIIVPGDKKLFRRGDDLFVPLDKLKRIGNDVILVGLQTEAYYSSSSSKETQAHRNYNDKYYSSKNISKSNTYNVSPSRQISQNRIDKSNLNEKSYVRLRPLATNKYK